MNGSKTKIRKEVIDMADDREIEETPVEEVPTEEIPAAEEAAPGVETEGTSLSLTADEVPDLQGMGPGDEIVLGIDSISEDGKTFQLSVRPVAGPIPGEEGAAPIGGREAVEQELLGG
jgi:hypothetical protein